MYCCTTKTKLTCRALKKACKCWVSNERWEWLWKGDTNNVNKQVPFFTSRPKTTLTTHRQQTTKSFSYNLLLALLLFYIMFCLCLKTTKHSSDNFYVWLNVVQNVGRLKLAIMRLNYFVCNLMCRFSFEYTLI